jgi:phosphate transport system permease protein
MKNLPLSLLRRADILFFSLGGLSVVLILLAIMFLLFYEAFPLFEHVSIFEFLFTTLWYPTSSPPKFGVGAMIMATAFVSAFSLLLAAPLGIGTAVFLREIAPQWVHRIAKPIIETLAAIPSVVYGFFGLIVVVPFVQKIFGIPSGECVLSGCIILSLMILPTIVTISEDALTAVPLSLREASLALGATKWQTIYKVTVPAAFTGIATSCVLALGRAIGETMAVLMVTGNAAVVPKSLLSAARTLTAGIAAEHGEAVSGSLHYHALFCMGALLFLITLLINMSAETIIKKWGYKEY